MIAIAFAAAVAVIHVYIFYLESMRWGLPATNRAFGVTESQAESSKLLAFNQGFYNLFLALAIVAGLALQAAEKEAYGHALVDYACLSVLCAGLVLYFSRPALCRPAMIQGLPALAYLGFRFLGY